jgi:hypothetical protein
LGAGAFRVRILGQGILTEPSIDPKFTNKCNRRLSGFHLRESELCKLLVCLRRFCPRFERVAELNYGSTVLKTNNANLRIGGAQTFWLRVSLGNVSGQIALMTRSRANNGQRGISLQLDNGRLLALLSEDGSAYKVQLTNSQSTLLSANTWYDISLRFDPSKSLRIDLYDPATGSLLETLETTSNIPASIVTTNSIGNGYFQVGGINNGSGGSSWLVPDGTLIEAAGVWNRVLTDGEIASLSAIPEPASASLAIGSCVLAGSLALALRRRHIR